MAWNIFHEDLLYAMIESTSQNDLLVGAYLLLGIQKSAERYFNRLDSEQQENFCQLGFTVLIDGQEE